MTFNQINEYNCLLCFLVCSKPYGMANRNHLYFLREVEKLEVIGKIASGIAHEIRNPLTTVRGYLQVIQEKVDKETASLISNLLLKEIDSVNGIITDFLSVTQNNQTYKEIIPLKTFMECTVHNILFPQALHHQVDITIDVSSLDLSNIIGNRGELIQVFSHCFLNSLQAKTDQPLKVHIQVKQSENYFEVIFSDNGKGIDSEVIPKIFNPFFTTKDDCKGLGLSIVKRIIENHNGYMNVSSHQNRTSFYIYLPIYK